jgi:hypothetical protein
MAGGWPWNGWELFMSTCSLQRCIGHNSSRVTKGKRMFVELGDPRSKWARRWNDLVIMHATDLGGLEMLSEAQMSICRRVAALECELESLEGKMSASHPVDIEVYARLTRTLCRLFELVGIRGRAKPLDPQGELVRALERYADCARGRDCRLRFPRASAYAAPCVWLCARQGRA